MITTVSKKVTNHLVPKNPGLSLAFGSEFLDEFVDQAAQILGAEMVTVGAFRLLDTERIHVRASHCNDLDLTDMEYSSCIAPCHDVVMLGRPRIVYSNLHREFPDDEIFIVHKYRSYVGIPLKNDVGEVIGLVQASWKKDVNENTVQKALELFTTYSSRLSHTLQSQITFATMKALAVTSSNLKPTEVFRVLAKNLQSALTVKIAFITECVDEAPGKFRILALCKGGEIIENAECTRWKPAILPIASWQL